MVEEIQKIIAAEKEEIRRKYKAEIKGIFGSYARGDFHADSDLDLLTDFDEDADLLDLYHSLANVMYNTRLTRFVLFPGLLSNSSDPADRNVYSTRYA